MMNLSGYVLKLCMKIISLTPTYVFLYTQNGDPITDHVLNIKLFVNHTIPCWYFVDN